MNKPDKRLDDFESFLIDNEQQSKADALAELRSHGVNVDDFLSRVKRIVQDGFSQQLRASAEREQSRSSTNPGFLSHLGRLSREAMLAVFEKLRQGEFGPDYREAALARCRNKDASELSDEELRSWLEDIGGILGEPEA